MLLSILSWKQNPGSNMPASPPGRFQFEPVSSDSVSAILSPLVIRTDVNQRTISIYNPEVITAV